MDTTSESLAAEVNESLRMKGMLLEDEDILRAMEQQLAGVYIPAKIKAERRVLPGLPGLQPRGLCQAAGDRLWQHRANGHRPAGR